MWGGFIVTTVAIKLLPFDTANMREIRARFAVPGTDLHPWAGAGDGVTICPVEVYRMKVLADDTATIIAEFTGDPEHIRADLIESEKIVDATVTAANEGIIHYHFEPRPVVRRMIRARRTTALAMQMPLELNEDGSATGTFYGDEATFEETIGHLPEVVEVEIEHLRDVSARERSIFDRLTERQREVLDKAVSAGYYEDPRGATHAELAAELDVSPTTVSEHLRRIERRIFRAYRGGT